MLLIGTQANLAIFDVLAFIYCAPHGIEFSLEDEEGGFRDYDDEDETYDAPAEGGFLKNLQTEDRSRQHDEPADFDEIDVDVDVQDASEEEEDAQEDDL